MYSYSRPKTQKLKPEKFEYIPNCKKKLFILQSI